MASKQVDREGMSSARAKVLLVAYACRPGESSEREVGWRWANLIQERHDVTVLTRASHRSYIEEFIAQSDTTARFPSFIYFDLPKWFRRLKKGERGLYLYYAVWSFFAILKTRRMNQSRRWEITHFLTFGTLIWPQFAFLMNTKYILGPVGGGERIPLSLRRAFSRTGQIKIVVRRLVQWGLVANPVYWANLLLADRILARTSETQALVPRAFQSKTDLMLETAMPGENVLPDRKAPRDGPLAIIAVGRLITSKFNPLLLESLHRFKEIWGKPFIVRIIGDGPERGRLEALRDELGLEEVVFMGKMPSGEVLAAMKASDIYFSTTMKEGGTWAFFEAITCGLPIVCLKVNGPDMIVGDGCGIKVLPTNYEQVRDELAQGLLKLADDNSLRADYSQKALSYLNRTHTWDIAMTKIDLVYREVLAAKRESE